MSSLSLLGVQQDNENVKCPYNASHRISRKRLQAHLIKCRLQYPDIELQKCPFNQTHLVPQPEFEFHVTSCPDRKLISQYRYESAEPVKLEDVKHRPIECSENWDDDDDVDDYNPQLRIANDPKLLRLPGMPAFRKRSSGSSEEEHKQIKYIPKRAIKRSASEDDENDAGRPATPPPPKVTHWPSSRRSHRRSRSRSRSRSPLNRHNDEYQRKYRVLEDDYNADDDPYYQSKRRCFYGRRKK